LSSPGREIEEAERRVLREFGAWAIA